MTTILCIGLGSFSFAQTKQGTNEILVSPSEKLDDANKKVLTNPTEAFDLAGEALVLSKATKDRKAEASSYNTLGTLYYNAGDYNKAIEFFTKAKNIYSSVSDSKNEEYTLKYLGKSHEALNENETSLGYYEKAEKKSSSSVDKNDYRLKNSKIKRKVGKSSEAIDELEQELKNNKTLNKRQKIDIYLELGDLYL
ncbi:MAG: tetratricopeptide repeat protein, partial [Bacteroidia bacterium]|nr:tetratricopeptide repeat protein [Bacteroidia bacterium]